MFKKILVGVDGSEISARAVDIAIDIAKQNNAEIHIAYVIESGFISPGPGDSIKTLVHQRFEDEGRLTLETLIKKVNNAGVAGETHLEVGHAGDTLVKLAEDLECDLIVVGSLGKSRLDRLLLGSVSSYVVNYAKMNILVVRG